MPASRARRRASAAKLGRYMTRVGPMLDRGALPTALILYPRARIVVASDAAAPARPFPFRTTTRVLARGNNVWRTGFWVVLAKLGLVFSAGLELCLATEWPSTTVPATINRSSSTAATPLATTAAVRHGRTASNGTACSTGASSSLPGRGLLQGFPGQPEAVLERLLGSPVELALGQRRVGHATADVTRPRLCVCRRAVDAGHSAANGVQLVDRRLDPGADVVDAAGVADRGQHAANHVADVDEVAPLLAVAEDGRLLAGGESLEEDRDHASLEARLLPRPVDVREPQRDVPGLEEPVPAADVLLTCELRDAVRRDRDPRCILRRRAVAFAVDRPAGRAEDDVRAVRPRRLEHSHRPEHVHLGVVIGPLDRGADVGLGGEVDAELRPHRLEQRPGVRADVADVQLGAGGHFLAAARDERVEHVHLVAAGEQRRRDMRADEARPACHHRPQGSVS